MPAVLLGQAKNEPRVLRQLASRLESEYTRYKKTEETKDKVALARSLGTIGDLYLEIARQAPLVPEQTDLVSADLQTNLQRCQDFSARAIKAAEEVGDIEQMKRSYKCLGNAQKLSGNVKGAIESFGKIVSLNHHSKKVRELEKKRLEYSYGKKTDSLITGKKIAEEHLEKRTMELTQKQKELEWANRALLMDQQEKALQAANLELQQSKLRLQQNELEKKDRDIEQRRQERYFYIAGILGLLALSLMAFRNIMIQRKYTRALEREKKRSEDLLLNILPLEVAEELKEKGFAAARHFHDVTVLFTDFVSFTTVAESMSPQQLVGELHICFKAFDNILSKYQIEKIKTVGDAYLAVSGLPAPNPNHATDIVAAAAEIRDFMKQRKAELGAATFSVRIGVNSGNVIAGIVGVRKFAYDIWGDTVNIAARMEQNCAEGMINISETTYRLVKDKFTFRHRGKIEAKNKGSIDMYYLE